MASSKLITDHDNNADGGVHMNICMMLMIVRLIMIIVDTTHSAMVLILFVKLVYCTAI